MKLIFMFIVFALCQTFYLIWRQQHRLQRFISGWICLGFCRFRVLDSYRQQPLTFIGYFEHSLETLWLLDFNENSKKVQTQRLSSLGWLAGIRIFPGRDEVVSHLVNVQYYMCANQHFFRGGQKITSGTWSILRYWWFVSSFQSGQGSRLTGLGPLSFGIEMGNSGEVGSLSSQNYIGWTANILTRGWQSWPKDCSSLGRSPSPWAWGWRRWWRRGRWARPRGSPLEGLEASHWGRESSRGWNCHNAQKNSSRSRRCQGHGTSWTRRSMPWWRTFPPSEDKKVKSYKFTVYEKILGLCYIYKKYLDYLTLTQIFGLYYIDKKYWDYLTLTKILGLS